MLILFPSLASFFDSFNESGLFIYSFEALPNIPFIVFSESKTAKVFTLGLKCQRVLIPGKQRGERPS